IRASRWRADPTREPSPEDAVLRVLVTEQTFSGAQRAHGRLLPPDLFVGADELVLTMFVTPRPGLQARSPNPEAPVRIALPEPLVFRAAGDGQRAVRAQSRAQRFDRGARARTVGHAVEEPERELHPVAGELARALQLGPAPVRRARQPRLGRADLPERTRDRE